LALPLPRRRRPHVVLERQADDLPKTGLFAEPVHITRLDALEPEEAPDGGGRRVVFLCEIRDSEGKRCSDLSVEAELEGPGRLARVQGTTDLLGRIRFRMAGPSGNYRIRMLDVAAGGLAWDTDGGPTEATTELS
jgi:hypothetical protein